MTDNNLLESLKQRNPEALATLFTQYADKIYHLAISILHDEQTADCVVQDTFIKLIEKIDSFEGRSHISTWLYRIAYNDVLEKIRNDKPNVSIDEDIMPQNFTNWKTIPDAVFNSQESQQHMTNAIADLPSTLQTVFILRDVEGFSTRDVANTLNITESAVKVRLHRARLSLREKLADYFEEYVSL